MSSSSFVDSSSSSSDEGLWTASEVARFLSMSPQWVYKHAELGSLPCVRLGSSLRFQPSAIRRYVEKRAHQGNSMKVLPLHQPE